MVGYRPVNQLNFVPKCRVGRLTRPSADQRGLQYAQGLQSPLHISVSQCRRDGALHGARDVLAYIEIDVFAEPDTAELKA